MKLGVMQPYFFPYLGYWQLMNAVDTYVIYDDVNYIKGGHINRNAILLGNEAHNINLILFGASPNLLINQVKVSPESIWRSKLCSTIRQAYARAPYVNDVYPIIESIINNSEENLAKYLFYSFHQVGAYLGIRTEIIFSSEISKDFNLKGKEKKIIQLSQILDADEYYNSINGIPLYAPYNAEFEAQGIQLKFLKMKPVEYPQFKNEFIPNLSIIDVMMFNSPEQCHDLLLQYEIIRGEEAQIL